MSTDDATRDALSENLIPLVEIHPKACSAWCLFFCWIACVL